MHHQHPKYLLILLILTASSSFLHAQSDPSDRLSGTISDSIAGGPPAVYIQQGSRWRYSQDRNHVFSIDLPKSISYFNLTYDYMLSPSFSVGGEFQVSHSLLLEPDAKGVGAKIGARFYPAGKGPLFWNLRLALQTHLLKYQSVSSTGDTTAFDMNLQPTSIIANYAYRQDLNFIFLEFALGGEYVLNPLKEQDIFIPFISNKGSSLNLYFSASIGKAF